MIRKLNLPTAIALVLCLTLAPSAMAFDFAPTSWFDEIIQTVQEWVASIDLFEKPQAAKEKPTLTMKCEPGGENGPMIDPSQPGCG